MGGAAKTALGCARKDSNSACMMPFLRFVPIAFVCAGLSGCLILDAPRIDQAIRAAEWERCWAFIDKGIAVTEPQETAIPTDEGTVQKFAPVFWGLAFEREGRPQLEQSRTPIEGTLVITDRSILFVPPPGTAGVRIPYEIVVSASLSPVNPHSLIVRTLCRRFDVFAFWQKQPDKFDSEAAAVAVAQLKAHVATIPATAHK